MLETMSKSATKLWPILFLLLPPAANSSVAQQTAPTLTQLTSNNTSASSAFGALPNGDAAPGNVSKVSVRKLLPPGFNGKILAHWMPWWKCSEDPCEGSHDKRDRLRVHYSTEDRTQIDRTIADMISRGYDGVMVAESNSGGAHTAGTLAMARETQKFANFLFSVSENHLNKIHSVGEQWNKLMSDMLFAQSHYFNLPNYLRIDGRPVVYIFDNGQIDWARAEAQTPGNAIFILDGPSHATGSLGGFYWFGGLAHNSQVSSGEALRKLDSFYFEVAFNQGRIYSGSFFKGFDDGLAPWGEGRKIDQACGLTFIRSLATATKRLLRAPANLALIQVATWNDYEEGTEVETGIDNCGSVRADVSGTNIKPLPSFTNPGSEETVDHYEVYLSVDGENLLDAGSIAVGGEPFDAATLGLVPGTYKAFIQMVGKSHILNRMSPAELLSVGGVTTPGQLPIARMTAPSSESTDVPMEKRELASNASVTDGAAVAANGGAHISVVSPAGGSHVSNPVALTITTSEPFAVARIQVWDHGVKIVDQIDSPSVDARDLHLNQGMHSLTINVEDESMKTRDSVSLNFEVQ
jgi:hypothetical protein